MGYRRRQYAGKLIWLEKELGIARWKFCQTPTARNKEALLYLPKEVSLMMQERVTCSQLYYRHKLYKFGNKSGNLLAGLLQAGRGGGEVCGSNER